MLHANVQKLAAEAATTKLVAAYAPKTTEAEDLMGGKVGKEIASPRTSVPIPDLQSPTSSDFHQSGQGAPFARKSLPSYCTLPAAKVQVPHIIARDVTRATTTALCRQAAARQRSTSAFLLLHPAG